MAVYCKSHELPGCCANCKHHDYDSQDEYSPNYHYCNLALILPTKGSCKKQSPVKGEAE